MEHIINQYLSTLNKRFITGNASEHTYRKDLEDLLRALLPDIEVTNEPSQVTDCGNPDYLLSKKSIPIGFIEAKDIGKDLHHKQYKEQFNRYRNALDNLIITDYCWFQFFKNGELVEEIRLADIVDKTLVPRPENFARFTILLADFVAFIGQTISSPTKLAQMMAGKARLLENTLENALTTDIDTDADTVGDSELLGQFDAFKRILIDDLTPAGFADIYAQTLAYGMFAARLHDDTLDTFSRQEAAERIPKSNPFLRRLFDYVAGANIDERIKMTVDNLADVFRATDVAKLLTNFAKNHDPIIHFYETFLSEYNPKLRKQRGVWYTPESVVNFIVRAVDDVLKTDFHLTDGLASTDKTTIKLDTQTRDARTTSGYKQIDKDVHKVQILDPATGTGTFLAAVIRHIYQSRFMAMSGLWNSYVDEHLIPRLNGFELLMAPYAMAHLKLDLLLRETGYGKTSDNNHNDQRLNIYLTNSLEPHHPDTGTLFASWLSQEANAANRIKRDAPVMVVIGNPPYSGESANKGDWIMQLMDDYKKEPGGIDKLNERNPKWINDDYVKFMRYGQHYIEKNGEGILAFINPHGFLDNPTFRGMRWQLLSTYDRMYVIDLHGNAKKKETCPDGSKDDNVFDIQQGVSINILVKTGEKKKGELGKVYHADCYGKRQVKNDWLDSHRLADIDFTEVPHNAPMHFFVSKDFALEKAYKQGFSVNEMFPLNGLGITTAHDNFVIQESKGELLEFYKNFRNSPRDAEMLHYNFKVKKKKGWDILQGYDNIKKEDNLEKYIKKISYRPFDNQYIFYEDKLVWRTVRNVMQHQYLSQNIGLCILKRERTKEGTKSLVVENICDKSVISSLDNCFFFPLYLYTDNLDGSTDKTPNVDAKIVKQFADSIGLRFDKDFTPENLLDYIYAVLHCPTYREKYKEFLKIDFPRIPFPESAEQFWALATLGEQLRQWHLLKHPDLQNFQHFISDYPIAGDNHISRKMTKNSIGYENIDTDTDRAIGRVWINDEQYFDNVPEKVWECYIGGYQPAQKWLKDRVGRTLTYDDIVHYQRIILTLHKTQELMQQIDEIS